MGTATCVLRKPLRLSHQESACEVGYNTVTQVSASTNSRQQQNRSNYLPSSLTQSTSWLLILVGLVICNAQWQVNTQDDTENKPASRQVLITRNSGRQADFPAPVFSTNLTFTL